MGERLQKLIAAAGVCSRRAAEDMIRAGRVCVNGETAQLGQCAERGVDRIEIDGTALGVEPEYVYIMLNKPRGCVTTRSDEKGRPTVMQFLKDCPVRVYPVGRLDMDSEGLLLLTNDGALTQRLLHPRYEVHKTYLVTVAGDVRDAAQRLARISDLDGERITPAQVQLVRGGRETAELLVTIHEGKNRQIRRMCAQEDLHVKQLRRIKEGALELGALEEGKWRHLTDDELRHLKG